MLYSAIHVGCSGKYRKTHKIKYPVLRKANKAVYDIWPGNEVGLYYVSCSRAHTQSGDM